MPRWEDDFSDADICDTCGNVFAKKFRSQTTCYRCWSETPEGMAWRRRKEAEKARASGGYTKTETKTEYVYKDLPGFDKLMVRKLLQLCHPDKHGQSELSVKVTQWLNERMREL